MAKDGVIRIPIQLIKNIFSITVQRLHTWLFLFAAQSCAPDWPSGDSCGFGEEKLIIYHIIIYLSILKNVKSQCLTNAAVHVVRLNWCLSIKSGWFFSFMWCTVCKNPNFLIACDHQILLQSNRLIHTVPSTKVLKDMDSAIHWLHRDIHTPWCLTPSVTEVLWQLSFCLFMLCQLLCHCASNGVCFTGKRKQQQKLYTYSSV